MKLWHVVDRTLPSHAQTDSRRLQHVISRCTLGPKLHYFDDNKSHNKVTWWYNG